MKSFKKKVTIEHKELVITIPYELIGKSVEILIKVIDTPKPPSTLRIFYKDISFMTLKGNSENVLEEDPEWMKKNEISNQKLTLIESKYYIDKLVDDTPSWQKQTLINPKDIEISGLEDL